MNYMPGSELEEIMDCNTISLKQSIWWQVKYSEENCVTTVTTTVNSTVSLFEWISPTYRYSKGFWNVTQFREELWKEVILCWISSNILCAYVVEWKQVDIWTYGTIGQAAERRVYVPRGNMKDYKPWKWKLISTRGKRHIYLLPTIIKMLGSI